MSEIELIEISKERLFEIISNKNFKIMELYQKLNKKEEEIERLNNIIKELEEYMIGKDIYKILLYKLRDLKEDKGE